MRSRANSQIDWSWRTSLSFSFAFSPLTVHSTTDNTGRQRRAHPVAPTGNSSQLYWRLIEGLCSFLIVPLCESLCLLFCFCSIDYCRMYQLDCVLCSAKQGQLPCSPALDYLVFFYYTQRVKHSPIAWSIPIKARVQFCWRQHYKPDFAPYFVPSDISFRQYVLLWIEWQVHRKVLPLMWHHCHSVIALID